MNSLILKGDLLSHPEGKYDLNGELPQPGLLQAEAGLLPPVPLEDWGPEEPALPQVFLLQDSELVQLDLAFLGHGLPDLALHEVVDLVECLLLEVAEPGQADLAEAGLSVVLPELVQDEFD